MAGSTLDVDDTRLDSSERIFVSTLFVHRGVEMKDLKRPQTFTSNRVTKPNGSPRPADRSIVRYYLNSLALGLSPTKNPLNFSSHASTFCNY